MNKTGRDFIRSIIPDQYKVSTLLYRSTRDGFDATAFHSKCDNKGPTITIVKSKSNDTVFGGFSSVSWNSLGLYIADPNAFLYSVTRATKQPIKQTDTIHALFGTINTGPSFGYGPDLLIPTLANANRGVSNFVTYTLPFGLV